jgi:hydrogenase-4 component F
MLNETVLIVGLISLPLVLSIFCLFQRNPGSVLLLCASGTVLVSVLMTILAVASLGGYLVSGADSWLRIDALSAFHLIVLGIVYALGALQTPGYFRDEIADESLNKSSARRYGALWFGSQAAMLIVLLSNNMGVMWVGIEATTLLTAFLICVHTTPASLEAMWKYLLMCSVGVALAFTGTLLAAASTGPSTVHGTDSLLWTHLMANAGSLDKMLIKAGFIFMVIGYGTKAGLAPMHSWLPDAHSQAPAPVSAVFSGFLLNAALYCIFRCLPIVETATGNQGWGREILVAAGLLSILTAACFMVIQRDLKRMLAYSSLEHIGIIALGAGLGGMAAFAAMFHMLSHSIGKSTAFMCAGRLIKAYKTTDMRHITGTLASSPLWGAGLLTSLLALLGTAPFALFFTEFMILRTAVDAGNYPIAIAFLAGISVVFIGALRYAIPIAWKPAESTPVFPAASLLEHILVIVPLSVLLAMGIWMPPFLTAVFASAAAVLGGTP